jgi:putative copper export protein
MSRYEILLFLHLTAAIVWVGSNVLLQILATMTERAKDDVTFAKLFSYSAELAPKLFVPAGLLTVLFGIGMVADGPWSFDMLWLVLALVGFAGAFGVGIAVFKPEAERIAAMIERDGGMTAESTAAARRFVTMTRFDLVVLFVIVFDMAVKPTGDDVGALLVMAAALIGGVALVHARARTQSQTDTSPIATA